MKLGLRKQFSVYFDEILLLGSARTERKKLIDRILIAVLILGEFKRINQLLSSLK